MTFPLRAAMLVASLAVIAVANAENLAAKNSQLLSDLEREHRLDASQMSELRQIFGRAPFLGQGNPAISRHPMTLEVCRERTAVQGVVFERSDFERICGARFMAPLYDPGRESMEEAAACIDQFEFPNLPCSYPVVWVRAREAQQICAALGKRLCDAHEWEGACAGSLEPPDYRFDLTQGVAPAAGIKRMADAHNAKHNSQRIWAYGNTYQQGICATGSAKSQGCQGGGWNLCGSNTYPSGSFPACQSALGVYDQHGNAAEHMNLPLAEDQMTSRGSTSLGFTEMKGSWFIFDSYRAHEDSCRWRAPFWHGSRVMDAKSHHNYHLGFRCCKTLAR